MKKTKPFAFVLMPFDGAFDDVYQIGILDTCNKMGIVAERVDKQLYTEPILERIYRQIRSADLIIADMTGRNANVFYEVGYAHALGKRCSLITKTVDDIPFDLKHHRHIVYDGSLERLRNSLEAELGWQLSEIEKANETPFTLELQKPWGHLDKFEEYKDVGKIELKFDLHNHTSKQSPEIEHIYLHTGDGWSFSQDGSLCASRSEGNERLRRHFIKPPVRRLAPGGWAQVTLKGEKTLWTKWNGEDRKSEYQAAGAIRIEIGTAEKTYTIEKSIEIELDNIPF